MDEAKYRVVEGRLWASVGRAPTEQFVQLPRIGVKVRVQEVGDGPPVLFVHGGPNSGSTWAPLVEHIEGFRCLLLDRPGTGLSERVDVDRSEFTTFASRLVGDTLEALGIERAHVVASSLGGYCALWSASAEPERFERMVQMACPALLPGQQLPKFMKAPLRAVRYAAEGDHRFGHQRGKEHFKRCGRHGELFSRRVGRLSSRIQESSLHSVPRAR